MVQGVNSHHPDWLTRQSKLETGGDKITHGHSLSKEVNSAASSVIEPQPLIHSERTPIATVLLIH